LQEKEFERVGESRTIRVDTRLVAATNQHLTDEIEAGRFRDDLYYRLNVVPIYLPPLRERREDISGLAAHFLKRHADEHKCEVPQLGDTMLQVLQAHDWPGNVRELENYMERALVLAAGRALSPDVVPPPGRAEKRWKPARVKPGDLKALIQQVARQGAQTLPEGSLYTQVVGAVERELIEQVLQQCDGVQITAARRLGINRNTLHKKVTEYQKQDGKEPAERDEGEPPPA
jgi:Nif-specific regulatory protein